ncbi:MAG: hypothetical protein FJ088_08190, partial [Deltaproteobacteria bacterium]|nr:hypothetical protein [Deltaproteobacteria bacterium]
PFVLFAFVLLIGAIIYRQDQFDAYGKYIGGLVIHPRWIFLHMLISLSIIGALYHLVKFVLNSKMQVPHLILTLSTFGCAIQIIFTMQIGHVINLSLYRQGLLVYLIISVIAYGYRVFDKYYLSLRV